MLKRETTNKLISSFGLCFPIEIITKITYKFGEKQRPFFLKNKMVVTKNDDQIFFLKNCYFSSVPHIFTKYDHVFLSMIYFFFGRLLRR